MTIAFGLALGLILGSFLNVCIHRMPEGETLGGRSRCPKCRKLIVWHDNIPLLSYAFLGGRCRRCRAKIPARYPLVEALMGVVTAGLVWRWEGGLWLAATIAAAGALIALSFIDFDTFYIPDVLSVGLIPLGLAVAWNNPWFEGGPLARTGEALLGAGVGLALTWGMAVAGEWLFKKEALGGGDIKLLAGVGALLGWQGAVTSLMIASFAGSAYGLWLIARGRIARRDAIPFGPFISLGALVNLFHRFGPLDFVL